MTARWLLIGLLVTVIAACGVDEPTATSTPTPLDPGRLALGDGRWQDAIDACSLDADGGVDAGVDGGADAGLPVCDARWCQLLGHFGLVMNEINDYVLPTFRAGDTSVLGTGNADVARLGRLLVSMNNLSATIDPIVADECRYDLPKMPFRFGDAAEPVASGEFRGVWTPRDALFVGASIDSVRYIFDAIAGLVTVPPPPPGSDVPALPKPLDTLQARLLDHDKRLFSEPADPAHGVGGWDDKDKDGKLSKGDELLVDLFDPATNKRVFDFTDAEVVRADPLPLGSLVPTSALPAPRCAYQKWHIDTLFTTNVGTTDGMSFSPDGKTIVFPMRVDKNYQVHAANLDGSNVHCLTCDHQPPAWNDGVRWQPGGNALVFISTRDHKYAVGGAGGGFGQELYAMRPDGSGATRLTNSPAYATNYHVNWSHDGKRVVWGTTKDRTWDVMVADFVDDAKGMRLENVKRITHDTTWWETHDFTLDGKKVITTNTRAGYESADIYAIDLASGARTRLTDDTAWDEHAHLSPDGRKMSWISGRWAPASVSRLTDGSLSAAHDFFWIGPAIFFNFLKPPAGFITELTMMDNDGSNLVRLTDDGMVVADNQWSPDSTRILFRQTPTATKDPARIRLLTFDDCN